MAKETERTRELSPADIAAMAKVQLDARLIETLTQSPGGIALLGQREANAQLNAAVTYWQNVTEALTGKIFPELVSLTGSLAAQNREAAKTLADTTAALAAAQRALAEQTSTVEEVLGFISEHKETIALIAAPLMQQLGAALAAKLGGPHGQIQGSPDSEGQQGPR